MSNDTSTKKEDIMPDISDADIEAILSASADEEEKADDASDELLEAALQEVELEVSKIDAYEEQDKKSEPEPDPVPEEIVEEEAKKAAKPKRKRKAKAKTATAKAAAPAPTPAITGEDKPSDILRKKLGKKVYEICVTSTDKADKEDVDALLERLDNEMPVKVKEKIVNLFLFLDGQAELSTFSRQVFEQIEKRDGSMTFHEIKKFFIDRPYTAGTAGTQASQMKWIFDITGMCERKAGYTFTVNPDSILWPVVCARIKTPVRAKAAEEESEAA